MATYRCGFEYRDQDSQAQQYGCGYQSDTPWHNRRCPKCRRWVKCTMLRNTQVQEKRTTLGGAKDAAAIERHSTRIPELDHVLGGGLVYGSSILFGGPAGTGKSTLLLLLAARFARQGCRVLFASGEQREEHIIEYARRLEIDNDNVVIMADSEGLDIDDVKARAEDERAKLVITDSIQVLYINGVKADIGTTYMIDSLTNRLTAWAGEKGIALVIVSHLNGDGGFAGSAKERHLVDVLLRIDPWIPDTVDYEAIDEAMIESMRSIRELSIGDGKNRFGDANAKAHLIHTPTGLAPLPPKLRRVCGLSKIALVHP